MPQLTAWMSNYIAEYHIGVITPTCLLVQGPLGGAVEASTHCVLVAPYGDINLGGHCLSSINPLWASDTIWWYRSGSTLAQIMAWCHQAPSHYLNQYWLIIKRRSTAFIWEQFHKKCLWIKMVIYIENFRDYTFKISPHLPGANESSSPICYLRST